MVSLFDSITVVRGIKARASKFIYLLYQSRVKPNTFRIQTRPIVLTLNTRVQMKRMTASVSDYDCCWIRAGYYYDYGAADCRRCFLLYDYRRMRRP